MFGLIYGSHNDADEFLVEELECGMELLNVVQVQNSAGDVLALGEVVLGVNGKVRVAQANATSCFVYGLVTRKVNLYYASA